MAKALIALAARPVSAKRITDETVVSIFARSDERSLASVGGRCIVSARLAVNFFAAIPTMLQRKVSVEIVQKITKVFAAAAT